MINGLEIKTGVRYSEGMTDQRQLINALLARPHEMGMFITHLMGAERYPLSYLTQGMGRSQAVAQETYEWAVMANPDRAIALIDIMDNDGNSGTFPAVAGDTYGINRTTFKLKFGEKWFGRGDVIMGNSRAVALRVQSEPEQHGNGWVYVVTLVNSVNPAAFFPVADLQTDAMFHKEYSLFGEYSEGGHSTEQYPFKMRNQLNILRQSKVITGSAATLATTYTWGKNMLWMNEMEAQFMRQWYEQLERNLWYGEYNADDNGEVFLKDNTGYPIRVGAGVLQQISAANTQTYSVLTESIIRDFLSQLHVNSYGSDNKHFVAFTGYWGMDAFDRAMKESAKNWTLVDSKFITGSGSELMLGGQFVTYKGLNGVTITLKHLPMLDDEIKNRKLHPVKQRPLESYRFIVLDMSMYEGKSNVVHVHREMDGRDRSMMGWYVAGSTTPTGGAGKGQNGYRSELRSSARDGYSIHLLSERGIFLRNPMSCGQLICTATA